jgi:hypothetical protein
MALVIVTKKKPMINSDSSCELSRLTRISGAEHYPEVPLISS